MALEPVTLTADGWTSLGSGLVTRTLQAMGGSIRLTSGSVASASAVAGVTVALGASYDLDPGIEYHARAALSPTATVELIERAI